jgi:hypothetical protein
VIAELLVRDPKPERSPSSSQATISAISSGRPTRPTGCWA